VSHDVFDFITVKYILWANSYTMTCPNCSTVGEGNYCSDCGQSLTSSRITWKYLFSEIQQRIFGFDNKFARTVRDLTIRPDRVIHTVINGIQVQYFGPLGYYFLLITIYVLLVSLLDIDMSDLYGSIYAAQGNTSEGQAEMQAQFGNMLVEYFRLFSLLMIPFFILGNYLVFKNKKYNFLENGVVVLYAMGHPMLLSIILLLTYKFSDFTLGFTIILVISYLYHCWVCARFYPGNKWWNFVKGLIAIIASHVFLMIFAIIAVFIYFLLFPEAAQNINS